ncbi:MAG: hypothetical protein ACRDCA_12520 [Serratia sp. (in: enterobacteria)]|uniref:hypothetical protein n=1 Tax=Serratia sp. (in: enterobacteria) TaxID=616 RepID=UPI003F3340E7
MNDLDGIIKFMQSPLGRMLVNGGKEFFTNHLFPYFRQSMAGSMKPVEMSEEEIHQRAKDEFATVDDFDIEPETTTQKKEVDDDE